jgi:hypothetical protein
MFERSSFKGSKEKQVHKVYKILGNTKLNTNFSFFRTRCKLESKRLYNNCMYFLQDQLYKKPQAFWKYVRNLQGGSTIPNKVHLGKIKASGDQVANLFASFFFSVFVDPRVISETKLSSYTTSHFSFLPSHISVSVAEFRASLELLSNTRGTGSNGIAAPLLYFSRDVLNSPTCSIFN